MPNKRFSIHFSIVIPFVIASITIGVSIARKNSTQSLTIFLPYISNKPNIIYSSTDLYGHSLFAECNPGGGTNCPCSDLDASIESFENYGEVISNPREVNTYVNAIGFKKFTELFPDDTPISLGIYKYKGQFKLPVLPAPLISQTHNPQAIHLMIQFWDGRNALWQADKRTLEGVIYWDLNPWVIDEYGKIKVYTNSLELKDSGKKIIPDTNWHSFELIVDLENKAYKTIIIDGEIIDLTGITLASVYQPDWGKDISLSITTESMASWPQHDCRYIFTWSTEFKNISLSRFE
jgi:hypothetical protein